MSTTSNSDDADYMTSEINVIGRTADEAESEVERFVERAFLAGLPRIRVVHGVGMGILRRTLRDFLTKHPHVTSVSEPPYNEGGQGATIVELRVLSGLSADRADSIEVSRSGKPCPVQPSISPFAAIYPRSLLNQRLRSCLP